MKKIFKAKSWLTMADAAKRLSITFEEEVSTNDIIQLALEGQLMLSWYLRHQYVQEIAFMSQIRPGRFTSGEKTRRFDPLILPDYKEDRPVHSMYPNAHGLWALYNAINRVYFYCEGQCEPYPADGPHRILVDTDLAKNWLMRLLTGKDAKRYNFDHFLLITPGGELVQPMELERPVEGCRTTREMAYPTSLFPELEDLVIQREDLEAFERQILPTSVTLRTPENNLVDALGVMALLLEGTNTKFSRGNKPNAKQIAEAIEQRASTLGIALDGLSNINKDIAKAVSQIADKIPS